MGNPGADPALAGKVVQEEETVTEQRDVIAQPDTVPIGAALSGAASASVCGAIVVSAASFLLWGFVCWQATLIVAILPIAVVWLGSLGYAVRVAVSWNVRPQPPATVPDGDNIRLIPVHHNARTDGMNREDLAYFVRTALDTEDWSQRAWRTKLLPSGRKCDCELHAQFMAIMTKFKVIDGYGPRQTGYATMSSDEALKLLGLSPTLPDAEQSARMGDRVQSRQFSQDSGG